MADDRAAAGLVIPRATATPVADGKQAQLTIVSTQGSSGAATVASEVRSLAGEQVTVELASRAAAEAIWATGACRPGAGRRRRPVRRAGPARRRRRRSPTRP